MDYCRTALGGLKDEQFRVIFLNSQNEIIAEEIIQEGTVNQTVVYPRKVLELALKHKATGLILVHNHPSGSLTPSASDKELTQTLIKACRPLNLTVHDHLIISRHDYFSLAETESALRIWGPGGLRPVVTRRIMLSSQSYPESSLPSGLMPSAGRTIPLRA